MCGLVGILGGSFEENLHHIEIMKDAIIHRGPDGDGTYVDSAKLPVFLGHRRLAIIDPAHGKQPLSSADGAVTIVFNGAIYNYLELHSELIDRGHALQSYSDTEVLLYAYLEWGETCVSKLNGMFAFAIWDKRRQLLFCARDRVGIKPFYYYHQNNKLVFASEIKAILTAEKIKREVEHEALQDYLTFQFCLGEKTLFKNIKKLEPGHLLIAKIDGDRINIKLKQYWDVVYKTNEQQDESYFSDNLAVLLTDSLRQHLRSDVPLGAHLSGGLDSSAMVCLTRSILKNHPLKTFTGSFKEGAKFNETAHAKALATYVGADYHEIFIPSHEFAQILPKLIYHMDEPAAGPGLIPQYYVAKLAAQHVKVVLGGQGGDELYVGYARYLIAYLEKCLSGAIDDTNSEYGAHALAALADNLSLLKSYKPIMQYFFQDDLFGADDRRYFKLLDRSQGMRQFFDPQIFKDYSTFDSFKKIFNRQGLDGYINQMTYFDFKASLPALLHVDDRTSMAASIESRVPLLDHRLVEFMACVPAHIKFANGKTKHLFKEAIKKVVPDFILQRKDKMGFPVPLHQWLQSSAKDFVADILFSQRARERGIYNIDHIEKAYETQSEFCRSTWGLLCIELWHRIYIDGDYVIENLYFNQ